MYNDNQNCITYRRLRSLSISWRRGGIGLREETIHLKLDKKNDDKDIWLVSLTVGSGVSRSVGAGEIGAGVGFSVGGRYDKER